MKICPDDLDFRKRHHLFSGTMVPRGVYLISTISEDGICNVAPFASIVTVSVQPSLRGFEVSTRKDGQPKDTLKNIWFTNDFVLNLVDESMAEAMNQASADYPPEIDEFKAAGFTPAKADMVTSPMVGESSVSLECKVVQILEFGEFPRISRFVIAEVLLVHIKDDYLVDGELDKSKLNAIGRLGGDLFCRTSDTFVMKRDFVL